MAEDIVFNSITYSSKDKTLEIEFSNGGTVKYYDIEPLVYSQFEQAEDMMEFYNTYIVSKYPRTIPSDNLTESTQIDTAVSTQDRYIEGYKAGYAEGYRAGFNDSKNNRYNDSLDKWEITW